VPTFVRPASEAATRSDSKNAYRCSVTCTEECPRSTDTSIRLLPSRWSQKPRRLNISLQQRLRRRPPQKGTPTPIRNSGWGGGVCCLTWLLRLLGWAAHQGWGCRPAGPNCSLLVTARWQFSMRERDWDEGHSKATKALVLAVAGLMTISLISNLVLLILY
jgi:hypothetical protein